jgi:hypothetical protein
MELRHFRYFVAVAGLEYKVRLLARIPGQPVRGKLLAKGLLPETLF